MSTNLGAIQSDGYLEGLEKSDTEARGEWIAYCELNKLLWTDRGNLKILEELARDQKNSALVQSRLARAYLHYEDTEKAKKHFRKAVGITPEVGRKIALLGELANSLQKNADPNELLSIIGEMRDLVDGPEQEDKILSRLAELSDWHKDDILKIAILERELIINPANIHKRFQLAYIHSQNENEDLAVYHYEKIPWNERDGTTWNNLGVAYQKLKMPAKSVDAYKKAAEKDETLAMSNIANLLMSSGSTQEAGKRIEDAQKLPNYNDKVAASLARLKEIPVEENRIRDEILKGLNQRSDFFGYVGEHVWQNVPKHVPPKMVDTKCVLDVTVKDGAFVATGTYVNETKSAGIANALLGASTPAQPETYQVGYRGRIVGRVIIGEKTEEIISKRLRPATLLGLGPSRSKFILVLPEDVWTARGMIGGNLVEIEFREEE